MPAADGTPAVDTSSRRLWDADRLASLFAAFLPHRAVLLAVSGGPDSTALMLLAQQWRVAMAEGPVLHVASVDHGLRREAAGEAAAVGLLAARLGLSHVVLPLDRPLSRSGIQEAARDARYAALVRHAQAVGAAAIATGHTLDDQAETVLFRLMRGSGLSGLAGMPAERLMPGEVALLRPLLGLRKAELVAACRQADAGFVEDPSNRDPRFTRARLRLLLPQLEREGLGAERLARLAARVARADAALEAMADQAADAVLEILPAGVFRLSRPDFTLLPAEIGLRLLGRAIRASGTEGVPELGKLEALLDWIAKGGIGARTLSGALLRATPTVLAIAKAPPRRRRAVGADVNLRDGSETV